MATSRGFTQPLGAPPRRAAPIQPLAPPAAPRSFPAGEAPPGAEALKLTKTSGAGGTLAQEKESTAGLPFRENVPPVTAATYATGTPEGQAQLARYDVQSPQTAVLAGLADLGYDPSSPIPAVRGLVESADAINQAYLIQSVLNGTGPITDPNDRSIDYANFVRGVIARGGNLRAVASQATRNVGAASRTLGQMAGTPEGQLAFQQDAGLQAARGLLSGQNAVKTLADLAGATYSLPGDKAQLEATQRRLQQAASRAAGRGQDVMDYLMTAGR